MKNNTINGLLIFNKPSGITSNNVLKKIKKIFKPKKIGYIGTLDPISSGILPICFGKTTKLSKYIIKEKKTYITTILLGIKTNTYDSFGYIIKKKKNIYNEKKLIKIIKKYKGKIKQKIPIYSSCKYKGKPLYKYAIKGIKIKKSKYINIYKIKIIKIKKNIIKLYIKCSKGTYIRSIINEIGKKIKIGAHIISLKRIKIGKFSIKKSYKFKNIYFNKDKKKYIIDHKILINKYKNKIWKN